MGLAAPRKKTKLSHDPNNTTWSRSTNGFGHKIMKAQGWTPGSFLGPQNAAHSDLFTKASASHIRVVLKDDTLGLGARPKRDLLDEPTGLDAFKGLLGRLNGRSETELAAEQQKRDDIKLARYAATKWQTVRFISGGFLVQETEDAIARRAPQDDRAHSQVKSEGCENGMAVNERKDGDSQDRDRVKSSKKKDTSAKKSREKVSKREKKQAGMDKKRKLSGVTDPDTEAPDRKKSAEAPSEARSVTEPKVPTLSRERRPMGRQVFRSRYIEQKKRALMDDKSLNEIFMIKT